MRRLHTCKDISRVNDYKVHMSTYNRDPNEKQRELERIEARLDQHRRILNFGLMGLSAIGLAVLALLLYHVTSL